MNYEKIYNSLIQKRRLNKIDRTNEYKNVEYHHIIPRSCDGQDDPGNSSHNNEKYNVVGLTLDEHFFAHLLLQRIYRDKYGKEHPYYKHMIKAIQLMIDCTKYKRKTSKLYKKLKLAAFESGSMITTAGSTWVTNGKQDIFLRKNESIPDGFHKGRTINFTEEQRQSYSNKIKKATKGRIPWNSGKHGLYSDEYKKKLRDNHANCSGENNSRFGSRTMYNPQTKDRILVKKDDIQKYINNGYVFARDLKKFNNGEVEVVDVKCPIGFQPGKLPPRHTKDELEAIRINRSQGHKKRIETLRSKGKLHKPKEFNTSGYKWMYNPKTNDVIYVKKSEIDKFLSANYIFGQNKSWYNDGVKNIFSRNCPPGFIRGKIKTKHNNN